MTKMTNWQSQTSAPIQAVSLYKYTTDVYVLQCAHGSQSRYLVPVPAGPMAPGFHLDDRQQHAPLLTRGRQPELDSCEANPQLELARQCLDPSNVNW